MPSPTKKSSSNHNFHALNDEGANNATSGDESVRRIQRLWRRYQRACEAAAASINNDTATPISVGNNSTNNRETKSKSYSEKSGAATASPCGSSLSISSEARLAELVIAARRIQNFWRGLYTAAGVEEVDDDDDEDDENGSGGDAGTSNVKEEKTEVKKIVKNTNSRDSNTNSHKAKPNLPSSASSLAAESIQRMWRRYRQAVFDHQEEVSRSSQQQRNQNDDDQDSNVGNLSRNALKLPRPLSQQSLTSTSSLRKQKTSRRNDAENKNGQDYVAREGDDEVGNDDDVAASAAVVEQCLRELQQECESLAGSIDDIASSILDDGDGDDEEEEEEEEEDEGEEYLRDDDEQNEEAEMLFRADRRQRRGPFSSAEIITPAAILRIQRWWRRSSSTHNGNNTTIQDETRTGIIANSNDREPIEQAQNGNDVNDRLDQNSLSLSVEALLDEERQRAESAIRALQFRFRMRRLRQIFEERDRSEAAERVQRAWRVNRTRRQHAQRLRDGMRDGAARVIQHAFRRGGGGAGGMKNSNPNHSEVRHGDSFSENQQQSCGGDCDREEHDDDDDDGERNSNIRNPQSLLTSPSEHHLLQSSPCAPIARNSNGYSHHNDDRPIPQCIVCLGEDVQVCFLPCGHAQTCTLCGNVLRRCPTCRAIVAMRIRIYL